jgi:lysyl-tRNA synthetase class 2
MFAVALHPQTHHPIIPTPSTTMLPSKADYRNHEEFINRSRKLSEIQALGIDAYPNTFRPTHGLADLKTEYADAEIGHSEDAAAGTTPTVIVAGRLVLFRAMGKNAFAQIQSGQDRIQVMFNNQNTQLAGYQDTELSPYKFIEKKLDLGDIIGIEGQLFRTQKGELTVYAKQVTLLCKTLLPLADKHAGLADKELRYRKRWLDLIANPEVHETFQLRSRILTFTRRYLEDQNFLEVETPILQSIYGGAEARPFTTNLHALDQEMFLRISLEIPLKKLIIGGIERVFEMGKVFRNEGIDRNHNPEFTLMEAYAAYWDYNDMMVFVENLFEKIALTFFGTTQITLPLPNSEETVVLDVKAPWRRMSMQESLRIYANYDVENLDDNALRKILNDSGHMAPAEVQKLSRGLFIAALFEITVEPHLIQPHHITDHPIETTPLCKLHRDPKLRAEGIVERFESFIMCGEICNAYTELNDPALQRQLLEQQAQRRQDGDEEASPFDEEFLESICQGMPPTGGIGIGIDRMIMLFTRAHSIRDVLYFPWMKPQH